MLKLFFSPASPYVRKVIVTAHETGQADFVEKLPSKAWPIGRDMAIVAENPTGKVPTAILDDGRALFDSRVICEYLDARSTGRKVFPVGEARWDALAAQALGDGLLDAALLARYESIVRPAEFQWAPWRDGQLEKVASSLEHIERLAPSLDGAVTIGAITIGCALGYLDFRFDDLGWRKTCPKAAAWFGTFSQRPSMIATVPSV